jgi:uncharacterized membrane protein
MFIQICCAIIMAIVFIFCYFLTQLTCTWLSDRFGTDFPGQVLLHGIVPIIFACTTVSARKVSNTFFWVYLIAVVTLIAICYLATWKGVKYLLKKDITKLMLGPID